ncbi:MAG: hypothetical protein M1832_000755 [Thelocarpon impressellum]|nr:MAG: hypothetical protein M1832_000755 [Thelocarpon impressellum]
MAPVRRYLRITKYSVLECRIYLDNPALASSWLLNPREPVLPRIIESVRPLVLPKLREESERARGKGRGKKANKSIKDVVIEDDFEVSIFFKDLSTRHSVLTKQKFFRNPQQKIVSNSSKLGAGTGDEPIEVQDDALAPALIRVESDGSHDMLTDIPAANENSVDEDSDFEPNSEMSSGRLRTQAGGPRTKEAVPGDDDKKKLGLNTSYDGFSIYGRILCLIVKRRHNRAPAKDTSGQALMEDWIQSTQAATEAILGS